MMANVNPTESEVQGENEKHTSRKRSNSIKRDGIKRNEGYFRKRGRPSSSKRPKYISQSSASDQVFDTSKDKNLIIGNIDFENNPTEVHFESPLNIDRSHISHLKECVRDQVIASDNEKPSDVDCDFKGSSSKKEDLREKSVIRTDDFNTVEFEKNISFKTLETEIKTLLELCAKELIDETPGTAGKDIDTDWPFGKISA